MITNFTIPATKPSPEVLDYEFLRQEGLRYIETLASSLWTDYNPHDPGITILENLAYTITDLGYRISLPIEDILTDKEKGLAGQFFSAKQILSGCPVTVEDYRKLFIDIPDVKNAWLVKGEKQFIVDCLSSKIIKEYDPTTDVLAERQELISLNGFYKVLIELEEKEFTEDEEAAIKNSIKQVYHANRNLCEDIIDEVSIIDTQEIIICLDLELENDADIETVLAQLIVNMEEYLAPSVRRYSLKELLEKGSNPEEIFDGVFLENGFIDSEELAQSKLREKVRVSDLIQLIMDIEGVKSVKSILLNYCDCEGDTPISTEHQEWILEIASGKKPVLCREKSIFNFFKGLLPFRPDEAEVTDKIAALKAQLEAKNNNISQSADDLPLPSSTYRDLGKYTSFQNDLPDTYGISQAGLPAYVTNKRRVQALQLKGYLLFFDQILANYFAQLSNTKELLGATTDVNQSYFSQIIQKEDLKGVENLIADYASFDKTLTGLEGEVENAVSSPSYVKRKNKLYDHLLARFAENFNEYVLLMHNLYGKRRAGQEVLIDKKILLKEYGLLSCNRGKGIDYVNSFYRNQNGEQLQNVAGQPVEKKVWYEATDTLPLGFHWNTTGIQHRLARLIGVANYQNGLITDPSDAFSDERFYVVEHPLLRPRKENDPYLPICTELDCSSCAPLDPYSFRVSVVFPGDTERFSNMDFRKFVEQTLRSELPAIVLAKVCWISKDQMALFETRYKNWLQYQQGRLDEATDDATNESLKQLIEILGDLVTIYPIGTLHDCEDGNDENPIILGSTQIGDLENPISQ